MGSGADTGSPPRMRGKLPFPLTSIIIQQDHPRGCGENRYVPDRRQRGIGSPPRMRGKRCAVLNLVPVCGITPADAGKTAAGLSDCRAGWDHPRGCGENGAAVG